MDDLISRQAAIDALWKALYEYEDKTEKQFQESGDLDVEDWIVHRIFVQNMNDIDRQTILNLPPTDPVKRGHWKEHKDYPGLAYLCSDCGYFTTDRSYYCPNCGAKNEVEE